MTRSVDLPIWRAITDGELAFPSMFLVEFDTQSAWYELIATVAVQSLRAGHRTDVHLFQRPPGEATSFLARSGLDVADLTRRDLLRVIDSYSVQTGIPPAADAPGEEAFMTQSVDLRAWSEAVRPLLAAPPPEAERGRLHIDGNIAVLGSYNTESDIVSFWRTRLLPLFRARESVLLTGVALGLASDPFYRQMEALFDGVVELGVSDEAAGLAQNVRIKSARGRRVDTRWRPLHIAADGQVAMGAAEAPSPPGAGTDIVSVLSRSGLESELREFLAGQSEIDLGRYRVLGAYTRYDEATRNLLKDFRLRVVGAAERQPPKTENFLVWAPPGSGKTFFVHELSAEVEGNVDFVEVNLAATGEDEFRERLRAVGAARRPSIVFVDEVDSKPTEPWPYEALLPALEPPEPGSASAVFVLAGSSGGAIAGLKDAIRARPKGTDLLSRVPPPNELAIPGLTREDRILVALTTLTHAAQTQGRSIREVEKLALFYLALNPKLASPRPLREFVLRGLEAAPSGDDRLKFDYFFPAGDAESKEFWMGVRTAAPELVGSFVRVVE